MKILKMLKPFALIYVATVILILSLGVFTHTASVTFELVGLVVKVPLVGFVAFSVGMAALACVMAGLAAGLIGTLVLTNVYKMNYETAFTRSFWSGTALAAFIVAVWTAVLDLLAGGLTTALVAHLWLVSLDCAFYSFIVAVVTIVIWGVMIFTNGRKHRG